MRKRTYRYGFILAVLAAVAISATVAVARSNGAARNAVVDPAGTPFQNIAALTSPASIAGTLGSATTNLVQTLNARNIPLGKLLPAETRVAPGMVDGQSLYLTPTDRGGFCALLGAGTGGCTWPLSASNNPAFIISIDNDDGAGSTVFGLAADGVRSMVLTIAGTQVTVPVTNNLFVYHGKPGTRFSDLTGASVTLLDGTTVPLGKG